jgi:lipoteichoic acid synthase
MRNKYMIFFTAVVLLWLKTYIVYKIEFDFVPIENGMQEFILFINPISSALLFFGLVLLLSGKVQKRAMVIVSLLASFVLYVNVVYSRSFDDFITIPVLFQTKNFGDLGPSALGLMEFYDIFYFADVILLAFLIKFSKYEATKAKKRSLGAVFSLAVILFTLNVGLANTERPQLLTRTFDREKLVKFLGTYNYHIYDIVLHTKTNAQKALADSNDLVEIQNYVKANHTEPNENLFGIAEGRNVIVVSMESLQSFAINYKMENGEEVTPFLNSLIGESFYFDNFYHQTGQGKTSDGEFLIENSLYPLPRGAVFTTNSQNEYNALPERLGNRGYSSAAFHGNNASFWNRDIMYKTLGWDQFYAYPSYNVTNENWVNYGINDFAFFDQSMKYLKGLPEPFYTKFITLTNHYPFTLKNKNGELTLPEDELIKPADTNDGTVNRYFQTVNYMDQSLKHFFENLKASGIYEDSIIVMYGDHDGISQNHNVAMEKIIGKEITPYETTQLQKVPLFIHIPGVDGKTISTVSGQIDVKPTLLHLLGMKTKDQINFGSDLFSKERPEFAVLRDGSFITDNYVYTQGQCYEKPDGEVVEDEKCEPYQDKAKKELQYSDKIVYGDLLRFIDDINTDLTDK